MISLKKILCPLDFSEASTQALASAAELASQYGAELYLVHVIPDLDVISDIVIAAEPAAIPRIPESEQPWNKQVQAQLQAVAATLVAEGLRVHTTLRCGDPANEIVRFAQEQGIDRIVIATHGNTGWRHLAFGSVTEKVVRIATCPVLTIRSTATRPLMDAAASTPGYADGQTG